MVPGSVSISEDALMYLILTKTQHNIKRELAALKCKPSPGSVWGRYVLQGAGGADPCPREGQRPAPPSLKPMLCSNQMPASSPIFFLPQRSVPPAGSMHCPLVVRHHQLLCSLAAWPWRGCVDAWYSVSSNLRSNQEPPLGVQWGCACPLLAQCLL